VLLKDEDLDDIQLICRTADRILWEAYDRSAGAKFADSTSCRLVFPTYEQNRPGVLRVSEQETRFAFVESLAGRSILYSVETPTQEGYQQTGSKPLSAQTDLTLYDQTGTRICNVEFKAKGVPPKVESHFSISKDIEKLLREPAPGLWFHLLEGVDNSTIPSLLPVIVSEMHFIYDKYSNSVPAPRLIIHICVLRHGLSLHKEIALTRDRAPGVSLIWDESHSSLRFSRDKLLEARLPGGWNLHHRPVAGG
jgi:hypothetical protein